MEKIVMDAPPLNPTFRDPDQIRDAFRAVLQESFISQELYRLAYAPVQSQVKSAEMITKEKLGDKIIDRFLEDVPIDGALQPAFRKAVMREILKGAKTLEWSWDLEEPVSMLDRKCLTFADEIANISSKRLFSFGLRVV